MYRTRDTSLVRSKAKLWVGDAVVSRDYYPSPEALHFNPARMKTGKVLLNLSLLILVLDLPL
jgi:hypothetical protein